MLQVDPIQSYLKIGLPPVLKAGSSGIQNSLWGQILRIKAF
jgi:hypothetical protein